MYMTFMSDYTVGHKNIYLEFPSFMGVLQKKPQPSEKPIYPSRHLYTFIYCKRKQIYVLCNVYFD